MGLFRRGFKAMFGRDKWKIMRGDKVGPKAAAGWHGASKPACWGAARCMKLA